MTNYILKAQRAINAHKSFSEVKPTLTNRLLASKLLTREQKIAIIRKHGG